MINISRLVATLEELVRRTVGPEIAVKIISPGDLWNTGIDPNYLENALLNLFINARDAMPHGGQLIVETAYKVFDEYAAREFDIQPGQYVSLSVKDNGVGMTSDATARVSEAAGAVDGLRMLRSNTRIDVLITDMRLPGRMSGRQSRMRRKSGGPNSRCCSSGYAENAPRSEGHLDLGMHVMTKPFT